MARWTPTGERRCFVSIQADSSVDDSMGTPKKPIWTTTGTAWAKIETVGGSQSLLAQQPQQANACVVKIPYMTGVDPTKRILFGSRAFSILGVDNVEERNRELWLNCREVIVGQGG